MPETAENIAPLKVAYLDIFGNNGSYEVPISFPDHNTFKVIEKPNVSLFSKDAGVANLIGEWNYAFYKGFFYFMERIMTHDVDLDYHMYTLVRDLSYVLHTIEDFRIQGELSKTYDKDLLGENIDFAIPMFNSPSKLSLHRMEKKSFTGNFKFTGHDYKPEEFKYVISEVAGNKFIEQYKKIPDPTKTKNKKAILASLLSTKLHNGEKILIDNYLNPLTEKMKKDLSQFTIVQADVSQSAGSGKYQVKLKTDVGIGKYEIPISYLKKIDFSGLEGIVPIRPSDFSLKLDKELDYVKDIEPDIKSVVTGYFSEADFHYDNKPGEDKAPTSSATVVPLTNHDYFIDNKMLMYQGDKSYDNTRVLNIYNITIDDLKKKDALLKQIDNIISVNRSNQLSGNVTTSSTTFIKGLKTNNVRHAIEYLAGITTLSVMNQPTISIKTIDKLTELPRGEDGNFDYEEIKRGINESSLEHTGYSTAFYLDIYYGLSGGFVKGTKFQKIMFFHTESELLKVHDLIRQLLGRDNKINPVDQKLQILREVYEKEKHFHDNSNGYGINKDQITTGTHLFDLIGTNYILIVMNGNASLMLKDHVEDTEHIIEETYTIDLDEKKTHIAEVINTKRYLTAYNKEYDLVIKKTKIDNLKITYFPLSKHANNYDYLIIDYSHPFQKIFETHKITRPILVNSVNNFNPIEYEDNLINYNRQKEDLAIKKMNMEERRWKEDQDLEYERRSLNLDGGDRKSYGITGGVKLATSFMGFQGQSLGKEIIKPPEGKERNFRGFGGFLLREKTIGTSQNFLSNTLSHLRFNIEQEEYVDRVRNIIALRNIENHSLDMSHRRLDFDSKKVLERRSTLYSANDINERNIFEIATRKLGNVDDVYIKLVKPSPEQMHYINNHYSHYGFDCMIPDYTLSGKDIKDKIGIGGFKGIKGSSIKEPVMKSFVMSKFINGVKLIKPNGGNQARGVA